MKRLATIACLVVLSCATYLNADCRRCNCGPELFDVYIGAGYRVDDFHYGDSERTFFLSDTFRKEFTNLEMVPFFAKAQYLHPCNFYANVYVSYAKVYDGDFKQTGFTTVGDIFTIHDVIEGIASQQEAFDASGALGWQFHFCKDFFTITPMVGYANYQQNLWTKHFDIIIGDLGIDFEPCDASQNLKAYWRGPWVGFSSSSGPYWCNWYLNWGWDYTFVFYTDKTREVFIEAVDDDDDDTLEIDIAYSVWNRSHGRGNHAWLGLEYRCDPRWSLGIFSDWRWFNANAGKSRFKFTSPLQVPFEICGAGRFDGAKWNSWNIYIMLGYHWF